MKKIGSSDCSSITTLFMESNKGKGKKSKHFKGPCRTPSKSNESFKEKVYNSASKVLDQYIRNYEKQQTIKLARSMTDICTQTPVKRLMLKSKEPSTLDKEINMARSLLPYHCDSSIDGTLSTDELLMATSTFKAVNDDRKSVSSSVTSESEATTHSKTEKSLSDNGSSGDSSTSLSPRPSRSSPKGWRRSRLRKTLVFSSDEDKSKGHFSLDPAPSTSSSSCSGSVLVSEKNTIEDQTEDLRKTWRLVDDLKADLASCGSTINGKAKPPESSLVELIERLSAAARRKEEKLRKKVEESMRTSKSMHISDLTDRSLKRTSYNSTFNHGDGPDVHSDSHFVNRGYLNDNAMSSSAYNKDRRKSMSAPSSPFKSCYKPYGDAESATPLKVQYEWPRRRKSDASTVLTTDNISEVVCMIDERKKYWDRGDFAHSSPSFHASNSYMQSKKDEGEVYPWSTYGNSPNFLTLHAGKTPYAPHRNSPNSDKSTSTDVILDGDRTWERVSTNRKRRESDTSSHVSVSFQLEGKPTAVKGFMEECLTSDKEAKLSGGKQPGSVEALKNMIFTLQSLTSKRENNSSIREPTINHEENVPGQDSLQRAMTHLNNLKNIIQH